MDSENDQINIQKQKSFVELFSDYLSIDYLDSSSATVSNYLSEELIFIQSFAEAMNQINPLVRPLVLELNPEIANLQKINLSSPHQLQSY